jgi:hypothetical protein
MQPLFFEGFRSTGASLWVKNMTNPLSKGNSMKLKLHSNVLGLVLPCLIAWLAILNPLLAQETNESKQTEPAKEKVFTFEGGNPLEFVMALDKHFRTRLVQILTLPETLSKTKVPKMKVPAEDPRQVLTVYNRLQSPTLGQWRFEPDGSPGTNMNALVLVPDKSVVSNKIERSLTKVKAIALAGVPETKWESLTSDIEAGKKYGEDAAAKGAGDAFGGSLRFQRESRVLIVSGSEAYIEMVESFVLAHRTNAQIEAKGPDGEKGAIEPLKR